MNTINYGSGAYGIEAASERYFSKDAKDLTLNEAATLVGIPQSPTYNNPIDYPDNCLKRRNTVLDRMVSNGVITAEEADATSVRRETGVFSMAFAPSLRSAAPDAPPHPGPPGAGRLSRQATFHVDGHQVTLEFAPNSSRNPFQLPRFSCP